MAHPRVDVGVVTWNTRDLTVRALRRLIDLDSGCDLRVLVRDNGSTDGTAAAIAREFPQVEVDAGEANLGFAGGMNTLIDRSDAPWFLALNSDAWPEEDAIHRLVETAGRRPSAAAVAPRLERPDGELEHSTHRFPSLGVAALLALAPRRLLRGLLGRRLLLEGAWQHDEPRSVDWAVGAALLMRRSALEEIGGFDERFFMYVEDLDWCWRARRSGWEIRFEPRAVVTHVGNASGRAAYGSERTAAYLHNTYRFLESERGRLFAWLFRRLSTAGVLRNLLSARIARDAGGVDYWRVQLRAHRAALTRGDRPHG